MSAPDPVLRATGLRKSFGRRRVLHDVGLVVQPGTLVGVVGENGAGKSTLLKILAGELRPDGGTVALAGGLGYCPQAVILNEALTVAQHLDYFRAAYHLTNVSQAEALVETLAFGQYRGAPVGTLSGGTKQKLNLTLALMHDPAVLLLDEPYQGFDWETYLRFWQIAADLRARGRAILVISHLIFDQQRFDTIYQLQDGRLQPVTSPVASATAEEVH